jgi:hypothetical protein
MMMRGSKKWAWAYFFQARFRAYCEYLGEMAKGLAASAVTQEINGGTAELEQLLLPSTIPIGFFRI